MRPIRAALVAAVTATAVLAPMSASFAKAETVKDSTGDVYEYFYDSETGEETFVPVGEIANADLKKTTVKHTDKRVVATAVYTDLTKAGNQSLNVNLQLPKDAWGYVGVSAYDGETYPYAYAGSHRGDGECKGMKSSVSYSKDRLRVSVPRDCLKSPRWVKFHAHSYSYEYVSEEESHNYTDNGHNDQANWNGWSGRIFKG